MTNAENIKIPVTNACNTTTASRGFDVIRARTYSASSTIPGGSAGKTYPGSFDCEREKKTTVSAIQITRNALRLSASRFLNRRTAQTKAVATNTAHGAQPSRVTGR